jgi:hypothetical protein
VNWKSKVQLAAAFACKSCRAQAVFVSGKLSAICYPQTTNYHPLILPFLIFGVYAVCHGSMDCPSRSTGTGSRAGSYDVIIQVYRTMPPNSRRGSSSRPRLALPTQSTDTGQCKSRPVAQVQAQNRVKSSTRKCWPCGLANHFRAFSSRSWPSLDNCTTPPAGRRGAEMPLIKPRTCFSPFSFSSIPYHVGLQPGVEDIFCPSIHRSPEPAEQQARPELPVYVAAAIMDER